MNSANKEKDYSDKENGNRNGDLFEVHEFIFGADLSYVNQVLDHGGKYRDFAGNSGNTKVRDPYKIFAEQGTNVVRLRKWHNPTWVRDIYDDPGKILYSGLEDVERTIRNAKENGMAVYLAFHYSDFWADPGRQWIPAKWEGMSLKEMAEALYDYTFETLSYLEERDLMPEIVGVGNETNSGMLNPLGCYWCEGGSWENLGFLLNSGIRAVRDAATHSSVKTKVLLHVAQPENVQWWFDAVINQGEVTDFDIIGLSYYSAWSDVPIVQIGDHIAGFKQRYDRKVLIVETAYSWTMVDADNYGNIYGTNDLEQGYPATPEGQLQYMIDLTQQVKNGGGEGIIYWEPGWITSGLKDSWGQGSSWDNNTFFDHDGVILPIIGYMTYDYD